MVAHEALRLWQDRMICEDDKHGVLEIMAEYIGRVGGLSVEDVLKTPLIFTNLNQNCNMYKSVDPESFKL